MKKNFTFYFSLSLAISLVISLGNLSVCQNNLLMVTFPDNKTEHDYSELEIVSFNIESKTYNRYTYDFFEDRHPTCSSDGAKILFCSKRPFTGNLSGAAPKKLYVLDIHSKQIIQINTELLNELVDEEIVDCDNPIWSPAANEIAFSIGGLFNNKLVIFNIDSEEIEFVIDSPMITNLCWSSNGKYLGYSGIITEYLDKEMKLKFELGIIDIKNKKKTLIEQNDTSLTWGCIGWLDINKFLIYERDLAADQITIYEYDITSDNIKYVNTIAEIWPEDFSPKENKILFIRKDEKSTEDVWSLNIKTNHVEQITFDGRPKQEVKYLSK